ncbi:helix-turn-helix domain-containing protein [Kribbella sp. WER1]
MSTLKVLPDLSTDLVDQVAEEVRAHMARRRVTQVQLAEILGIKQVSVSERLRGKTPFRLEEIGIIATEFGIHPAVLLGGRGDSPSPNRGVTGA